MSRILWTKIQPPTRPQFIISREQIECVTPPQSTHQTAKIGLIFIEKLEQNWTRNLQKVKLELKILERGSYFYIILYFGKNNVICINLVTVFDLIKVLLKSNLLRKSVKHKRLWTLFFGCIQHAWVDWFGVELSWKRRGHASVERSTLQPNEAQMRVHRFHSWSDRVRESSNGGAPSCHFVCFIEILLLLRKIYLVQWNVKCSQSVSRV